MGKTVYGNSPLETALVLGLVFILANSALGSPVQLPTMDAIYAYINQLLNPGSGGEQEPTPPDDTEPIIVDSTIYLTSSLNGNGRTYVHGPNLGDYPVFKLTGSGVTLSNVVIDDGGAFPFSGSVRVYAAVVISGSNNKIINCVLKNCIRYGFTVQNAYNFYIGYNTVERAQYGISGSSGGGVSGWGKNGVIEYNNIKGMSNCGIKCKAFDGVIIRNNHIDLTPVSISPSKVGIEFSNDAPNLNVQVLNNEIIKESSGIYLTTQAFGITTDIPAAEDPNIAKLADPYIVWTGNVISNNHFTNCQYGILLRNDNFRGSGNTYTNCVYTIRDYGENNSVS